MEDKSKLVDEIEQAPQLGSGAILAAARKKQDKSIEEIAEELNLSITQIRTIELDQSEGLPEPTYVRGYIRSYAKLLGLEPEGVLEHYLNKNWQKSANLDDMPRGIGDAESSETSMFGPTRVFLFLLLAGALVFVWYSGVLGNLNLSSGGNNNANEIVVGTVETNTSVGGDGVDSELVNSNAGLPEVDSTAANAEATEEVVDASAQLAEPVAAVPTGTELVLTFTETSWVDIRDEQQTRLAYQSYPVGETLTVSGEGVLSVLIGNAKGVQMLVNGQAYDLRPHTQGVYAKFTIGSAE